MKTKIITSLTSTVPVRTSLSSFRAGLASFAAGGALLLVGCGDREVATNTVDRDTTVPAQSSYSSAATPAPGAAVNTDASAQTTTGATATAPQGAEQRDSARIVLHEEKMDVQKRQVDAGGVVVSTDVVTEQVEVPVELQRERIQVTQVPAGEADAKAATGEAFQERNVYIPLQREEAVVQKDVEVREVIDVQKETETEQRDVAGTVRREVADIERQGDAQAAGTQTAQQQAQPRLEERIRQDLRDAESVTLSDEQINGLTIIAQQDTIILQGSVPSQEASQQIEQRIRDMDGVAQVQNRLRIEGAAAIQAAE